MFADFAADFIGSLNPLARAKKERLERGLPLYDYASGSVHDTGILFPQDILKSAMDHAFVCAEKYAPDSKGQLVAREAISHYYPGYKDGDEERIILTPGTSQSYWYVFTLLANAGDEIVVPRPCYPLFEYIAKLCKVTLTYYDLEVKDGAWGLNIDSLNRALSEKTRAIVLISPHNPTGHVLSRTESELIRHVACEKNIPLIVDEVFYEFVFDETCYENGNLPQRTVLADCPLVFTLNGFSKMFALPGMKIGWIKVDGRPDAVNTAVSALEMIADTFLPVQEMAQFAAAEIFKNGQVFLREYKKTIRDRWIEMKDVYSVVPQGGFYGVKFIGDRDEDVYALELLHKHGVLVHPGYFFTCPEPAVVFSFLRGTEHFALV